MIENTVKEIISKKKNIKSDDITPQTRLKEDLGLDSFDAVEIVMELEKVFKIQISDESMQQFKILKDVVNYVETKIS
ncbi:acyl carrier protein ['Camptotheca acuminata' phytoplasma]|uniref:acyl carrier protein n=1 Tax='Camptotheca acuminata' phytoplasma TaxID=3239192 RepID=UPI003519DD52